MEQERVGKIYAAINAVQNTLNKKGITKSHKNAQQGFNFRGIDDVYNALSPLLAANGVCIMPRMLVRTEKERQTKGGSALYSVVVEAEFDFVAAADGSRHTVRTFGEAMDSGDKATNKAMSAAYKYACFQTFAIPTAGDNDGDGKTHKPQAQLKAAPGAVQKAADLEVLLGVPSEVTERVAKTTKGEKPAWDIVIDDTRVSTFDEAQANLAIHARDSGRSLAVGYRIKGNYKNAFYVRWEVPASQPDPEPVIEEETFA